MTERIPRGEYTGYECPECGGDPTGGCTFEKCDCGYSYCAECGVSWHGF